jgi:hypothetical protein
MSPTGKQLYTRYLRLRSKVVEYIPDHLTDKVIERFLLALLNSDRSSRISDTYYRKDKEAYRKMVEEIKETKGYNKKTVKIDYVDILATQVTQEEE